MPRYKIESTAQVRRIYEIEAATQDEAEEKFETDAVSPVHEEDISEEADDVREMAPSEDH